MKALKITLIILAVFVFLFPLIFGITIGVVNDNTAADVAKELESLPLPENTRMIESVSEAGKLVGNGNGMQYYGAIQIESELPLEKLAEYYSSYNCEVNIQEGNYAISYSGPTFSAEITNNCYCVSKWGSGPGFIFEEFDLRGR